MSLDLQVVIYGENTDRLNKVASDFSNLLNVQKIHLTSTDSRDDIYKNYFNIFYSNRDIIFIDSDTVKKTTGLESVINIIKSLEVDKRFISESPYVVLLNRYLDSHVQTHYIGEYTPDSGLSVFQSFNPTGSDAIYISKKAVEMIRDTYISVFSKNMIFKLVKDGTFNCYSFNPNLYVFRLEDSVSDHKTEYNKTSIITYDNIMEKRNFDKSISIFFSDNIVFFWVFIVFFICTLLIIFLRVFKIASNLI